MLLALGVVVLLVAAYSFGRALRAELAAREVAGSKLHTKGTVVGYRRKRGTIEDPGETCFPRVRFPTVDGTMIEVESDVGASEAAVPRVGERVDVYFHTDHPERATVGSRTGGANKLQMIVSAGLAAIAAAFVVIALR